MGFSPILFALCGAFGRWRLAAAFAFISGALTIGTAYAQSASAWLELKPLPGSGNMIQITGHALALDAVNGLDFSLSLRRQNKGNTSSSLQSGRFDLQASEVQDSVNDINQCRAWGRTHD